jgi:oxaloacetate decarboxylase gamma subunit
MENLVSEGLSLMVFGMGFVFTFLTLLVGMTTLMSKLVTKFEPEPVAVPVKARRNQSVNVENKSDDELVAVITAAVHKFRS